jgi:hypothetical protein
MRGEKNETELEGKIAIERRTRIEKWRPVEPPL